MSKVNSPAERAFFDAVSNGDVDTVERMVRDDAALLDAYDHQCFGATPITRACSTGSHSVLEALISMGADVNRRSDWIMGPWSPLHLAVMERNVELAEFLLKHGATLDVHGAAGLVRLEDLRRRS